MVKKFTPPRGPAIPAEQPIPPRGSVIADEHIVLPGKPRDAKAPKAEASAAGELWTFAYSGDSGPEGSVTAMPLIEMPKPKPITLQLFSRVLEVRQPVESVPQPPSENFKTWSAEAWTNPETAPGEFGIAINQAGAPATTTQIVVSSHALDFGDVGAWGGATLAQATHVRLHWGNAGAFVRFSLDSAAPLAGSPDAFLINVTPLTSDLSSAWTLGLNASLYFEVPVAPIDIYPNAAVRARIEFAAGLAGAVTFDVDWNGSLQLMASRVELSRVVFRPDPSRPFKSQPLAGGGVALVNGGRPPMLPTLTVPAAEVAPNGTRVLLLPLFARRVSLLVLYGDEGGVGDAPLGQFFIAFMGDDTDDRVAWIDAMSAREALFGQGLTIPAGVRAVALSNRTSDDSVRLGVVWHLGI